MLVRSSNKKVFMEVKILEVIGKEIHGYVNCVPNSENDDWVGGFKLAEYKNNDTAMKVLDEIVYQYSVGNKEAIYQLPDNYLRMEAV